MDTSLETPSFSVAIADGFISKGETSIVMQCHDRVFKRVTVLEEGGEKLFTAESKGVASMSWRRTVKDASGSPLFELRKVAGYTFKTKWVVESPDGREICSVRQSSFKQRLALDVVVQNEDDKDNEVMVEVRPKDQNALTTLINVEGASIAEIQMTGVNTSLNGLDRSVWRARVAGGVDRALVSTSCLLCM